MITAEIVEGVVNAFLKKSFDAPADTPEFHREMWGMCCSDRKYVAIAAPRGFAKSTAITHAYVITNIIFRERSFILILADTEAQAALFLDDIKKEFQVNEDLLKSFEIKGVVKDSVTDVIIEFLDGTQARIMAKGSGQSLRGVKWRNKRPDLIVCDDLENEELVMNKDRRKNFSRWFSGTVILALAKSGIIRVVGTILHTESQLNRLMPRKGRRDKPIYEDDLKEIANPNQVWMSARYRAHDKAMTKSLWPEYKPIEWLKEARQSFIDAGDSDLWAQEMLNVPFDESTAPFKRRDFGDMVREDYKQTMHFYISCDFATSEKQKTDYTAFLVAAIDSQGILYIIHVIQQRMEPPEIVETLFELVKHYDPQCVFVEKGAIWNMLKPAITHEMQNREFFNVEEMASTLDKRNRTTTIRTRMRAGVVKFDKSKDWWPDFEEECLRFPQGHDDQVDALSLLGLALNKFVEAPTPEEEQEDQYEEEYRESGLNMEGRVESTGY